MSGLSRLEDSRGLMGLLAADRGIKVVGVVAALSSASFAAYMINTDHSHPYFSGSEHLMIFAQPLRTRGRDAPFVAALPPPPRQAAAPDIDYTPVGSIERGEPAETRRVIVTKESATAGVLPGFRVRQVRDGIASIEGPDGSVDVAPGAVLRRAGRVKSIELRSGRWTVVTSDGTIVERP